MANWAVEVYDSLKAAETAIELIDSATSTINIFGFMQGAHQKTVVLKGDAAGGGGGGDATAVNQTTIITDTEKIYDVALGVSPDDGSLASFIATGGTALGTRLPVSKSLYDTIALDRLDHATYGLSALDTELALIPQSGGAVSWNSTALAAIQAEAEAALEGEDLDHLLMLDSAAQKYPVNCATDSVIAKILAKGDPAVPSTYDCTTDSLQALSDKSGGFSGDGGAAQDDSVKASLDLAHTEIGRQVSMMEFWSNVVPIATLTTTTADVGFPQIVVADIPAGATITRVTGMIRMRALNNSSASVNAINEATDAIIKVEKLVGGSLTALIDIPNNIWSVAASTKEGGMLIEGDNDASAEVDATGTYSAQFDGNCRVDGNNLDLIDVSVGLKVYFTA